jgi:type III secretion protein R
VSPAAQRRLVASLSGVVCSTAPLLALAAPPATAAAVPASEDLLGKPLGLVVALAVLSLLPFVLMTTTAFVKIATTLQIVKSAIGAQGVP